MLVGFTSSVVIVFQAAAAFGATPAQTASWIWALGLGMGLTSLGLSLWTRQPVLTAWSTPGAAAQRAAGYVVPVSPVIATTDVATLLLAPFGGYALNLAAITAAICMGREAHEDPARRWAPSAAGCRRR